MKKLFIFNSIFLAVSLFSFNTTYAEQCFPQGPITVSGPKGETLQGNVSPMGAISIDYRTGTLRGFVDSLGYFKASNYYTTVNGSVDTSCAGTSYSSPVTASMCSIPYPNGCTEESNYQLIITESGLSGTTNEPYTINKLSECRKQIDDYKQATDKWNQCMKDSYGYNTQTKTWGATLTEIQNKQAQADAVTSKQQACFAKNAQYLESDGSCLCKSGESFNADGYCITKPASIKYTCPLNSTLDSSDNTCSCNYGYANNGNGGCQTMGDWCIKVFGDDYYYDGTGNHIGACKIKDLPKKATSTQAVSVNTPTGPSDLENAWGIKKEIKTITNTKKIKEIVSTSSEIITLPNITVSENSSSTQTTEPIKSQQQKGTWIKKISSFFSSIFHF